MSAPPRHGFLPAGTRGETVVTTVVLLLVAAAIAGGYLMQLAAVCVVLVGSWVCYRYPTAPLVVILIQGVVLAALRMIPGNVEDPTIRIAGVRVLDLVFISMLGAVVAAAVAGSPAFRRLGSGLRVSASLLGAWLLIETVRNIPQFGLSTLGELGSRYLILVIPAFILTFGRDLGFRRRLTTMILAASLIVPLAFIPYIGALKGWSFGSDSRFFSAAISYGMILCLYWMYLTRKRGLRLPYGPLLWFLIPTALLFVFLDGHRSAWLGAATLAVMLLVIGEIKIERIWAWGLGLTVAMVAIVLLVQLIGFEPIQYFTTRSSAFLDPLADNTSAWRVYTWRAQLNEISKSPLVGQGLGGYWSTYVPEFGVTITTFPHSMYVLSMVKIGLLGLLLYLWVVAGVYRGIDAVRRRLQPLAHEDAVLVTLGLSAIVASLTFQLVYAVEIASMLWIGLGLAAAVGERSGEFV